MPLVSAYTHIRTNRTKTTAVVFSAVVTFMQCFKKGRNIIGVHIDTITGLLLILPLNMIQHC